PIDGFLMINGRGGRFLPSFFCAQNRGSPVSMQLAQTFAYAKERNVSLLFRRNTEGEFWENPFPFLERGL
ncbi:MAG: hypothetical protein ACLULM_09980, partial [Acutalibacter sp.]